MGLGAGGLGLRGHGGWLGSAVFEAVAFAGDLDDLGVVQEAVEDGGGGGDVAKELSPFFDGTVGGHECGTYFVTAHDDLEEVLAAFGRKVFDSHVVDDQQVATHVGFEGFLVTQGMFVLGAEFGNGVEDGTIENAASGFDQGVADGLGQMALAYSGRADKQHVAVIVGEVSGSQLMDETAVDLGIEGKIEFFEGFEFAEGSGFGAPGDAPLSANVEFVGEHEF